MYEVGIKKKNAFINYINALYFFKKKLVGGIKIYVSPTHTLCPKLHRINTFVTLISYRKWIIATGSCGHKLINFSQHFSFVKMSQ